MVRVLRQGGRVAISVARSLEHNPASQAIWEPVARHLNTTTTVFARQFPLGDAGELRALLESVGFADVTIVVRSYTVRQPRNSHLIEQVLASAASVIPTFASMNMEVRFALVQAVEREIGPALQTFVEGDEELYQTSVHIAVARKP